MDKAISTREEQLLALISEDPNDPFLHYALCLERKIELDWDEFLHRFPDYLPAYYQAGLCFYQQKQKEKAIQTWRSGIQLAEAQSDRHALTELKSILQNTLLEEEDDD